MRSEEDRHNMERKVHLMVEEAERRQQEADTLRSEVQQARLAEKEAKGKLIDFLNNSVADVSKSSPTWHGTTPLTPNGKRPEKLIKNVKIYFSRQQSTHCVSHNISWWSAGSQPDTG